MICFNILYFQMLLLSVVISFHDVRIQFPEVGMIEWWCASLTDELSILK
jgi:hypothetical protein